LREDLLTRKLETILGETVFISDREIEQRYRQQAEKAKIRYLLLPSTTFTDIELTDDALQTYLDAHLEAYQLPEQRVVDYILIDTIKLRQELEIPDAEQQAYYDEHIDEYTIEEQTLARHILLQIKPDRDADAAKAELAAIRTRIEGGEDFATLARELSEEPDSAGRGGSLGWFGRDAWGADFTEIVFGGEKDTLVGPVQTQYGIHLVEIQDYRPGGARPFELVSAQIRNRLVGVRAGELAETRASDMAARLGTEGMTDEAFRAFATGESLEVTTTEPFGERDVVPGIGRGVFVETTFGLKRDGLSEPIKLPRGWAIVRLRDIVAPRSPVLADVVGRVRPAALAVRQQEAAQEQLTLARTRLDGGEVTFAALAEELEIAVQESAEFGRGGNVPGLGSQPTLVTEALAGEAGTLGGPFTVSRGAVIFEVSERIHFDAETYAEEKDAFLGTERTARLNQVRAALIARRLRDLEVKYNPQVLEILGVDPSRLPS
jgi:peptidyl-prolyl cis-trans isomerase D